MSGDASCAASSLAEAVFRLFLRSRRSMQQCVPCLSSRGGFSFCPALVRALTASAVQNPGLRSCVSIARASMPEVAHRFGKSVRFISRYRCVENFVASPQASKATSTRTAAVTASIARPPFHFPGFCTQSRYQSGVNAVFSKRRHLRLARWLVHGQMSSGRHPATAGYVAKKSPARALGTRRG